MAETVTVTGGLWVVTDDPAGVARVEVRSPRTRLHRDGVILPDPAQVAPDGVVTFQCVPGPVEVAVTLSSGREHRMYGVVPDRDEVVELREVFENTWEWTPAEHTWFMQVRAQVEADRKSAQDARDKAEEHLDSTVQAVAGAKETINTVRDSAVQDVSTAQTAATTAVADARDAATTQVGQKGTIESQRVTTTANTVLVAINQKVGDAENAAQRAENVPAATVWVGDRLRVHGKTSPSLTGPPPKIIDGTWWVGGANTGVPTTGEDGVTPHIAGGTWWVGDVDTGAPARGPKGDEGPQGKTPTVSEDPPGSGLYKIGASS